MAGRNQTSYLIGLIGVVYICYFSVLLKSKYQRIYGIIASLIVAITLWRSQSRAAIYNYHLAGKIDLYTELGLKIP